MGSFKLIQQLQIYYIYWAMATQASQRKAYAARSQASNVLDGNQQPDIQRPGRRLQQQAVSNIFSTDADPNAKHYDRTAPAPAPFLTEDNAVNTHGRLGGYVEQSDSLVGVQEGDAQPAHEEVPVADNDNDTSASDAARDQRDQQARFDENQNVAAGHKTRNLASNIFDEQDPPQQNTRPAYDRNKMSNIF